MDTKKNAEHVDRSNEGRRNSETIDRRKGEDVAVKELLDSYEVVEERADVDRRDGSDQRKS